ncbi:outer membrane beta-barrel protein [Orenia metallireducens]|nr:outer membrane beta-barrel protein [Orenia metallireducens]
MMKRIAVIVVALVIVLNTATVFANDQIGMGFDYMKLNYKYNDNLEQNMEAKQVRGSFRFTDELALEADYSFGGYNNYIDSDFQNIGLALKKDFNIIPDTKLYVGVGGIYSNFKTDFFNQELFTIENKSANLLFGLERDLTDRIGFFIDGEYGLAGDYTVSSPLLEDNSEFEGNSLTDYEINSNYSLETGLTFALAEDLTAKVGYRIKQENLKNKAFSVNLDTQDSNNILDSYNITDIDRLTQGVFIGVETRF